LCSTEAAPDGGKPRKLSFRRLLLNKCQEEFEKGDAAMNAVAEREKKDKERKEAGEAEEVSGRPWLGVKFRP
jgi:translation initiation factor 4G